jgi:3-oxoacyl-[acyl-carrier protein] reductase
MQISLKGKVALVTGSGRGIGLAIAQKLASAACAVMIADIDESAAAAAAEKLVASGAQAASTAGDLTAPGFTEQLIDATLKAFGGLDIIVNNAGYTWDSVIQKTTDEQFQAMLDIHVTVPFRVLRAASGWLRESAKREASEGRIVTRKVVNITSVSGLGGNAGQCGYASGKMAVVGLTRTLAKEWGRYNITVNAVGFGMIDTRLIKPPEDPQTRFDVGGKQVQVGMRAEVRESLPNLIPLGRMGTPEDAANAVFFFCSPLSDYVTGEVLVCGGGLRF